MYRILRYNRFVQDVEYVFPHYYFYFVNCVILYDTCTQSSDIIYYCLQRAYIKYV